MHTISGTIERLEGDNAILHAGELRYSLSRTLLPHDCQEGDAIEIAVRKQGDTPLQQEYVKEVINTILDNGKNV